MTKKRYQKLLYALMQKTNQEYIKVFGKGVDNWGKVLKSVPKIKFANMDQAKVHSYAEAWESLKPIRNQYGM